MTQEDEFLRKLIEEEEITWQSMLFELVKSEEMDPWDIDISILSEKFLSMINEMKETNLKIGGKIILASTILLRLKSSKFIDFDLVQLESLIASAEDYDDEFEDWASLEEDASSLLIGYDKKDFKIYPRTPQPRKRKVSLQDLMLSLEHIIEKNKLKVKVKSKKSKNPVHVSLDSRDINSDIKSVFDDLNDKTKELNTNTLKFSQILPSNRREDLVATFMPLLHLTNQRVTDLFQEEAFSDFDIQLIKEGLKFEDLSAISNEE